MMMILPQEDPSLSCAVNGNYSLAFDCSWTVGGASSSNGENALISYKRTDGDYSTVVYDLGAGADSGEAQLLRLTPQKEYMLELQVGGKTLASQNVTAGATGVDEYDVDQPFVTITGEPTFDVVVFDRQLQKELVAVDKDGWLVWHTKNGDSWDQYDDAESDGASLYNIVALHGKSLRSTGMLETMPNSTVVEEFDASSTPHLAFTHECHIDRTGDAKKKSSVLSLTNEKRNITGMEYLQQGSKVVRWDRESNSLSDVVSLFDVFDVKTDRGNCSDTVGDPYVALCPAPPNYSNTTDDWTHANAIGAGVNGTWVLSVRHLSAVVAFKPSDDGTSAEKQWVLSSEVTSDFTFDSPNSHFYNQHYVHQLENGNLMLFDNGDSRPAEEGGQFSRVAEYELDMENMVATLVWQFAPKLENGTRAYSFHAGAINKLENGNRVGAFSCDNDLAGDECTHMIYEADEDGKQVARITVPWGTGGGHPQTDGYRGIPLATLGGESMV